MATKAEQMADKSMGTRAPSEILKRPYERILTPDLESGGYTAEILEFPGCVAEGETVAEAYANLEGAAEAWIEAALGLGQEIPEPMAGHGYAGKVALRLPRSLHRRASEMAARDGTSLNQFLVAAVAERVGAVSLFSRLVARLPEPIVHTTIVSAQFVMRGTDASETIRAPFQGAISTPEVSILGPCLPVRRQLTEGSRRHA